MKNNLIDNGKEFDFGKTSENYAKYRDIYPIEFCEKLHKYGVGRQNQNWLDLGTGTGVIPRAMYKYGSIITATDISEELISEAIRLSKNIGCDINYCVSPAEKSQFEDNSFDIITACQCFMYFDKEKVIPEIRRLLKQKGIFIKTYMSFLKDDEIASRSKALINKFNTDWTASESAVRDLKKHYFDNPIMSSFYLDIPFTRESWHGRTMTMRGVQAAMNDDTLHEFAITHKKMLYDFAPDEFFIRHKAFITAYIVK